MPTATTLKLETKKVPKLRFQSFSDVWKEKKMEEVLKIGSGKDYRHLKTGDIPVFGTGGYMLSVNKSLYSGETVCIGRKGTINKPFYYNGDIWTVDTLFYTYDYKDITPKFTYIIFQQIPWLKYNEASGVPSLSKSTIEKIKINLPAILEQQKIADFLGVVDGWIKNLKEQKENFESYRRAIMQKIFSQEIRFKDNGKSFPAWEEKRLEDVAKFRRGSFPQPYGLRKWYDDKNGFPFVQVFDVDDNFKLKKYTKRKITQEAKDLSVLTKKGTIVLTIQGSIGRIALTQYDACIDRTLLIFESFKMPIDKIFFLYVIFLLFEIEKIKAPGGTIKTITKEALSSFKLSIPSLLEQRKIAEFMNSIDNLIESKQQQITQAEQWKKGLMQGLFV